MPFITRRRYGRRHRRRTHYRHGMSRNYRVGASMSRPRFTRRKRVGQNLTREIKWFKRVQAITSDTAGNIGFDVSSVNVDTVPDFITYGTLYSQYKVLKVMCKFFPSNVGGESLQIINTGAGQSFPLLQRGDALTYTGKPAVTGLGIADIIQRSSARLIQPRRFHKRWVDRAYGYPTWGELNPSGGVVTPDPWDDESNITMIGENFTPTQAPGQQNFFYVMTLWKVLFRSRQE